MLRWHGSISRVLRRAPRPSSSPRPPFLFGRRVIAPPKVSWCPPVLASTRFDFSFLFLTFFFISYSCSFSFSYPFPMSRQLHQNAAPFGQYSRPRTLSSGDLGGTEAGYASHSTSVFVGGGAVLGGAESNGPNLAELARALRVHMDKVYSAEVLRSLLRRSPVTVSALQSVRKCLKPLSAAEVTRFLVRTVRTYARLEYGSVCASSCLFCVVSCWEVRRISCLRLVAVNSRSTAVQSLSSWWFVFSAATRY